MVPLPLIKRTQLRYPETILQFGTGRFLRAFAGSFVHRAQRGGYAGGICAVQSTGRMVAQALTRQGDCYTLWTRDSSGESTEVIHALSRTLAAQDDWDGILEVARSETLQVVISNTTEVGLTLDPDDSIMGNPPRSFPGKLARVLYERGRHFAWSLACGLIILPCELVQDNGQRLRCAVLEMARHTSLDPQFVPWLKTSIVFCNTLVDRIVPGTPPAQDQQAMEKRLGFCDPMMITAEHYRLWAVEGPPRLKRCLGFAEANPGIIVDKDITHYRVRKIRLLNGGHTLSVPLGILAGHNTVLDNMTSTHMAQFIEALLREEIGPTLDVDPETVAPYISDVLTRWRNPHLVHRLVDITLQATTKMRHRVMPTVRAYYERFGTTPRRTALGFAAYLLFMQCQQASSDVFKTVWQGSAYPVHDDEAAYFRALWQASAGIKDLVTEVCSNVRLWGLNIAALPGWTDTVAAFAGQLLNHGVNAALGNLDGQLS